MNPTQLSAPAGRPLLARALELQRSLDEALATRVEETPWGAAIYRDDLPRVTDLNFALVQGEAEELDAPGLLDEAERLQVGLPHRAIRVDDPRAAARLASGFTAAGWVVHRTALMQLRGGPDQPIDTSAVAEVDLDRIRVAREAAIRSVHRDLDVAAEGVEAGALQHESAPVRAYAALVGGQVAAYCLLRSGEGGAKLVEVQALARSQGHGVGRATIWAAVSTARRRGVGAIFVECEDDGWARSVYQRLGFGEVGKVHRLVRPWGD